jgi:type I restriction enzyme S subunit
MSATGTKHRCLDDFTSSGALKIQNGFPCGNWNDKGVGVLQLRPFNVTNGGQIDLSSMKFIETDKKLDSYLLRDGDVLFNNTNSEELVGKTAYWARRENAVLSNHMTILRVVDPAALNAQFLAFYLLLKWNEGHFHSICQRHVNQASVGKDRLGATVLPPIELPEQKKIAHILSTVQRAIEAQERIIQTTTELKKALMHKLFTEGLRHEPQKQTEIGPVPESWEIKTVGDYCDILNGYAFKSEDYVTTEGIPNFRVVNISWDGTVSMDDCKFLPESFAESHKQYLLNEGDILFVMVGATRGKLAQIPESILPALMNQNMWRIVPSREGIDRDYLFHHLRRSVVGLLQEDDDQARGFFKKSDFRDIPLAIPSIQEQIEIRTALGTLETKLGQHAAKAAQLNDLFRTLLHELMTAKIRVHKFEISA